MNILFRCLHSSLGTRWNFSGKRSWARSLWNNWLRTTSQSGKEVTWPQLGTCKDQTNFYIRQPTEKRVLCIFALLPDLSKASAGSFHEVKGSSKKHLMASQNMTRRDSRGLKNLGVGKVCGAPFTASGKARNKALLSLQADFQKQGQGPIFVRLAWKCFKHERVWLVSCNGHQVSCRKPLASSKWQKKTLYRPNTTSGTPPK